jgi:hypothetical protein
MWFRSARRSPDCDCTTAAEGDNFGTQQDQRDPQRIGDEKMCDLHPHRGEEKNVYRSRSGLQKGQKYDSEGEPSHERRRPFVENYDGDSNQKTSQQSGDNRMPDTQAHKNVS